MKRAVRIELLAVILSVTFLGGIGAQRSSSQQAAPATDPVLFFSDISSGPKTGNSDTSGGRDGRDGAIVTIWGRNLGNALGGSKVYANGAEAASYYLWESATGPADLHAYHRMQKIAFQISHLAQDGPGSIYVVVNGRQSNSLPFTVRSGSIYFAGTTGHDETGDGSWGNPWRTIPKAADSLAPGDIAYIGDGVDQLTETAYGAAVNLGSDGRERSPKALVVYPGATSNVGNATTERGAFHVWNSETGSYSIHWVIAGFSITTGQVGVTAQTGFRVVGNHITAPQGDGADGAIGGVGNDVYILGNELENVGSPNCSKLYHAVYISGVRQDDGPRAPTESNREVAWNYIHDCKSNRAINVYSEQAFSAFIRQHRIHDNVILNQRGDGILLGYYVTGENWIYNNLIVNAGLGPDWLDDPSYHTGVRINTGHEEGGQTTVHFYNNTLYGSGWAGAVPGESGGILVSPEALTLSTTVYLSNNIIYSTGEPYLASESTSLPVGDYRNCWYGLGPPPDWDTAAIHDDPDFVDAAAFNFRLQTGSPCIDAGRDAKSIVPRDILGTSRPQGLGYDLGAYEFITPTTGIDEATLYLSSVLR